MFRRIMDMFRGRQPNKYLVRRVRNKAGKLVKKRFINPKWRTSGVKTMERKFHFGQFTPCKPISW